MRSFTFLGTGTSTGVPVLGCDCSVCHSPDPKNKRNRAAAVVRTDRGTLLIDTPPELRLSMLAANVPVAHAVLYTHYHADHLFGLDDLRQFPRQLNGPVPVYCAEDVEAVIRTTFPYIFPGPHGEPAGYVPKLEFNRIVGGQLFHVLGQNVLPIPLVHAHFRVLGFRLGDLAYCTDVNRVPEGSLPFLDGLKVLVVDALRYRPHPAHFSLGEALELVAKLKPERAYLTHLSHEFDHAAVERDLPPNIRLGYDGLTFEF